MVRSDMNIGRSLEAGGMRFIDGSIEEFRVYDRILTPAEITCVS